MKLLLTLLCSGFLLTSAIGQNKKNVKKSMPDATKKIMRVEAACGECKFDLKGDECDLAVKIDGVAYFVDGTGLNDHGDAHAKDGFCNSVRMADVQGEIVDNRFKASYFKLLPAKKKKATKG